MYAKKTELTRILDYAKLTRKTSQESSQVMVESSESQPVEAPNAVNPYSVNPYRQFCFVREWS